MSTQFLQDNVDDNNNNCSKLVLDNNSYSVSGPQESRSSHIDNEFIEIEVSVNPRLYIYR